MLETLTCEQGHTWQRERVRGRKPVACPEHRAVAKPAEPTTNPPAVTGPDPILVELYVEETGLPKSVIEAFVMADEEPPYREVVDAQGYTFRQVGIIDAWRKRQRDDSADEFA